MDFETEHVADGVPFAGIADRGFQERGQGQLSVPPVGLKPAVHGPGYGHGQRAPDGHGTHSRLLVGGDGGGVGGTPAGVEKSQVFLRRIVHEPEGVSADPAHVGVDHVEDGIGGDGRIHRRSPLLQNVHARLGSEIMRRGHHAVGGHDQRTEPLGKGFRGRVHSELLSEDKSTSIGKIKFEIRISKSETNSKDPNFQCSKRRFELLKFEF
jgi:hypothetical protein